jgi:pimeloyl-ACP methyl ester carboxylesterase
MAAVAHRALLLHQVDLRPQLARIHQPVLIICGDQDPLVGRACEADLMRGLPQVARAEIENCRHLPQFTHPEVLSEIVKQFLTPATGGRQTHVAPSGISTKKNEDSVTLGPVGEICS